MWVSTVKADQRGKGVAGKSGLSLMYSPYLTGAQYKTMPCSGPVSIEHHILEVDYSLQLKPAAFWGVTYTIFI